MYRLIFLNGKFKGKRLTIQQGSILIGRDPECQIDLSDDAEVSRHHAVIEYRGGSPILRDLGSINPVSVNQQTVKEHRLHNGDQIEVGRTIIEFQTGSVTKPPRHRRRFSKMQATSYGAIGLIVLLQIVFVIFFPLWQKTETVQVVVPKEQPKPEPAVEPLVGPMPQETQTAVTPDVVPVVEPPLEEVRVTATIPEENEVEMPEALPAGAMETDRQAQEVLDLRTEIEDLRKQVEEIAAPPPLDQRELDSVREAPVDPLLAKAKEMLVDAEKEISLMNYFQADNILDRIQMMSPDFMPAWRERALLFEKRGMLKQAGEQWEKIMRMSAGTTLYNQAAAERQRVARLELTQKTVAAPIVAREVNSAKRLEKRIRIVSVERERFRANEEYDEMRLVRVTLRPRNSEGTIDANKVIVVATFYDRVAGSNRIVPTRALVPEDGLRISGAWAAGEARNVSAAYIVKKGFRTEERNMIGEEREYEGYRVMVYYRGVLQDENAMPSQILDLDPPPPPPGASP